MKIKVEGLDKLQKKLKDNVKLTDVKRVVKHNVMQMTNQVVKNADFDKGYQTGETKRSVSMQIGHDGLYGEVGATTEYAGYLEYGTRLMSAQPFIKPAFDKQEKKFKRDIERLMK